MSLAQDFFDLFKGSDIAHGTFVVKSSRAGDGKKQGTAKVIRELHKNKLLSLKKPWCYYFSLRIK